MIKSFKYLKSNVCLMDNTNLESGKHVENEKYAKYDHPNHQLATPRAHSLLRPKATHPVTGEPGGHAPTCGGPNGIA